VYAGVDPTAGAARLPRLDSREVEVLRLVADGLTNAKIGAWLFVSDKTVEHHVSRILGKLGVSNRREAAKAAHQLDLPTQ
jgi:DNA-binding NarL/FixJ family response regulator